MFRNMCEDTSTRFNGLIWTVSVSANDLAGSAAMADHNHPAGALHSLLLGDSNDFNVRQSLPTVTEGR